MGDIELARTLLRAAAAAKADAVKFHVFMADELAVPSYRYYGLFKRLEWTRDQWKSLIDQGHSLGLEVIADVFGLGSALMLQEIGIDVIKIHATDIRNKPLLEHFASIDLPLLLSAGGARLEEMTEAVRVLRSRGLPGRALVLMHGFQSYPTLIEHTNLRKMKYFGDSLGLPYGFADHIDGEHVQNFSLSAAAVGMGAVVLEKHITIDRSRKMEDYESALDPAGFTEFVDKVRDLEKALGRAEDVLLPVESDYRKSARKHVVALQALCAGQTISASDVALKRVDVAENPVDLDKVIGRKLVRDIYANGAILGQDVGDNE